MSNFTEEVNTLFIEQEQKQKRAKRIHKIRIKKYLNNLLKKLYENN